jgi:hypothetical protein
MQVLSVLGSQSRMAGDRPLVAPWMRTSTMLLTLLLLLTSTVLAGGQELPDTRVMLLVGDNRTVTVARAVRHFEGSHPDLRRRVEFRVVAEADLDSLRPADLERVRLLLLDSHSTGRGDAREKPLKKELIRTVASRGRVLVLGHSLTPRAEYGALGGQFDDTVRTYWDAEGWKNVYGMLCHIVSSRLGLQVPLPAIERHFGPIQQFIAMPLGGPTTSLLNRGLILGGLGVTLGFGQEG